MLTIDIQTARRFILGKQGLWPGRRWRGIKGTEEAMRAMEYLQLDPLQIIARSHDITLQSRVLDYKPDMWEAVTYQQRKFFDWVTGWPSGRWMNCRIGAWSADSTCWREIRLLWLGPLRSVVCACFAAPRVDEAFHTLTLPRLSSYLFCPRSGLDDIL